MSHKDLSKALDGFVSILTEQELEPIRLDLIRIENDLKNEFYEKFNDIKEAMKNSGLELEPIRLDLIRVENDLKSEFEENFNVLREAIQNLATKVSEAFAEGLSEVEAELSERQEELSARVTALETKADKEEYEI